jgi:hypothetical protein
VSFKAYGFAVEVEPVINDDQSKIQRLPGAEDDRSIFLVKSVGGKIEGIETGNYVYSLSSAKFIDRLTGVTITICRVQDIIAVSTDIETFSVIAGKPDIKIVGSIIPMSGDPSLN